LNAKSKTIKDHEVLICGPGTSEVTVSKVRHGVNLVEKTCSCRTWQVTGKPCTHALAAIAKQGSVVHMEDYVHEYYSIERFKKAYAGVFNPKTSKHQWACVEVGYKICKSKLRRKSGRPIIARIKVSDEPSNRKKKKCSECNELGHIARYCQGGPTAHEKKMRLLSQQNASGGGSSDPIMENVFK
jgi:hypothetical protein